MENKVNYFAVGVFVISLASALVAVFLWLTVLRLAESTRTYVTYLNEDVSGLKLRSPVRFNGVKVGDVSSIQLNPNNLQQVIVKMKIKKSIPITTSTVASLKSEGLTGVNYIGLTTSSTSASLLTASATEPYPVIPSQYAVNMNEAFQNISKSILDLVQSVKQVFKNENQQAIQKSLANIEKVTNAIASNSDHINHMLHSANEVFQNGAKATQQLPQLMPSIQLLLQHLEALSSNLEQITKEIKLNPAIIVRGKAPARLGPGEKSEK